MGKQVIRPLERGSSEPGGLPRRLQASGRSSRLKKCRAAGVAMTCTSATAASNAANSGTCIRRKQGLPGRCQRL